MTKGEKEKLNRLSKELKTAFDALNRCENIWIDLAGKDIPGMEEGEALRNFQETGEAKTTIGKHESKVSKILWKL